ncbi:MAG: XdhC family protein [Azospirillaceae bacterium]|nr:XdhC family protein [Azospirillaceae bacterium]
MKRDLLDRLVSARADKHPVALVTDLGTGLQTLVTDTVAHGGLGFDATDLTVIRQWLDADRSGVIEDDERRWFVQSFNAPPRLLLVGAVHIAQALAPMAVVDGFDVVVIDPRGAFATDARFPGVTIVSEWPDDALQQLRPDRRSAIVTLTHDPKLDDPALHAALRSPAFYIGSLGSRSTHAARIDRLREAGFGEADIKRIHAPVGLAIKAATPAEIATAILAQIIQVRRTDDSGGART